MSCEFTAHSSCLMNKLTKVNKVTSLSLSQFTAHSSCLMNKFTKVNKITSLSLSLSVFENVSTFLAVLEYSQLLYQSRSTSQQTTDISK